MKKKPQSKQSSNRLLNSVAVVVMVILFSVFHHLGIYQEQAKFYNECVRSINNPPMCTRWVEQVDKYD